MNANIAAICMAILLSSGFANGVNNAINGNELASLGFSYHDLASNLAGGTVGFWCMGDPETGDPIYLDYGALYQYNHWIVTPQPGQSGNNSPLVSTNHLLDIANWNLADIQKYPELYSQNYYYNDLGEDLKGWGIWENGGSKAYYVWGPGNTLNSWGQIASAPDPLAQIVQRYGTQSQPGSNLGSSTKNSCTPCQDCYDKCIKEKTYWQEQLDKALKSNGSIVVSQRGASVDCNRYLCQ